MTQDEEVQHLLNMRAAFDELHAELASLRTRSEVLLRAAEALNGTEGYGTENNEHWDDLREAIAAYKGET